MENIIKLLRLKVSELVVRLFENDLMIHFLTYFSSLYPKESSVLNVGELWIADLLLRIALNAWKASSSGVMLNIMRWEFSIYSYSVLAIHSTQWNDGKKSIKAFPFFYIILYILFFSSRFSFVHQQPTQVLYLVFSHSRWVKFTFHSLFFIKISREKTFFFSSLQMEKSSFFPFEHQPML